MGESPEIPSSVKVDTRARLDLFKTLGDNTRYAIYLELARSPRPLTTAEIAEAIALHPNTVRPHLDRMREVGLIDVQVGGRGEIGRPQHRYSLASDAPSLGLEPPVMPLLARMVLAMAERLGADRHDAHAVGVDEGRRRSSPFSRTPSSLEAFVSDLDLLGFDPVVSDPDDPDDTAVVAFAKLPVRRTGAPASRSGVQPASRLDRGFHRRNGRYRGPPVLQRRRSHALPGDGR